MRPVPLEKRFWNFVEKSEGCWKWKGAKFKGGYGSICKSCARATISAHRVSWEIHHGPIQEGMSVLHHCDNPECTNPEHLFLGTQSDNLRDMANKGRRRGGAGVPPWKKVKACQLYMMGYRQVRISSMMGTAQRNVSKWIRSFGHTAKKRLTSVSDL